MGLRAYVADIWDAVVTTAKGMRITASYGVNPREEVTQQYPEERREPSERFRGFLHNDIKVCTSCTMCVKVCPVDCISLESVRGADKKMVLVSYDINIGRCMYCGLCVEVCPVKSLKHTSGYEMASLDRGELILHFVHEDPNEIKARVARQVAAKAEADKAKAQAEGAAGVPSSGAAEAAKAPAPAGNPGAEAPKPKADAQGTAGVSPSGTPEPAKTEPETKG
ncbi:MAG: NuoI/complex I 23 kDa subunit family protein [Gemmatimonadota bacterium]